MVDQLVLERSQLVFVFTPSTMASEDLLARLTALHNYVERELQGVVTAVRDLGVEERPTRKLHAILTQARERIQTALARQRMLLWKFSMESDPSAGHAKSARGEKAQIRKGRKNDLEELAVGSIRSPQDCGTHSAPPCQRCPENSNNNDSDEGAKVKEELEWKRDTLVRMKYLFQRKAGDHTADETDRVALMRDILKITEALEQVQRQTDVQQKQQRACATAPTRSAETPEESCSCKKNAGTSARSTCRRDESARESVPSTTTITASGGSTKRCSSVERERQEKGIATGNACSAQSIRNVDLRLPDGLDLLLRRIAEGVRQPARPVSSRLPSSKLSLASSSTHRGERNNEGGGGGSNSSSNGKGCNSNSRNSNTSLRGFEPTYARADIEEGVGGAVQKKAAPASSNLVDGTSDRTGNGCRKSHGSSRNARTNRVLGEARMASAANFGPAKTSPPVAFGGHAKAVFMEGLIGAVDKENQS